MLTLSPVTYRHAGSYRVVVASSGISAASESATLAVGNKNTEPLPQRAVFSSDFNAWFFLSENYMSWPEGKAYAERFGGHLAVIESAAENAWIWRHFSSFDAWIGLRRDPSSLSSWGWINGAPFNYENWNNGNGEPNNRGGAEYYVHIIHILEGRWNDLPISFNLRALVEVPFTTRLTTLTESSARARSLVIKDGRVIAWGRNDDGEADVPAEIRY